MVRVIVEINQETMDAVKQLSEDWDVSQTRVIHNAIGTAVFLNNEVRKGTCIVLEKSNGRETELVMSLPTRAQREE